MEAPHQFNWSWVSLHVISILNCVPAIDTSRGDAAHKRFRVVERRDVRFTDVDSEIDIAKGVFPARDRIRKILSEPAAGGYYMENYLRKFIRLNSWSDVMAIVNYPPDEVISATAAFPQEADTRTRLDSSAPEVVANVGAGDGGSDVEATVVHKAVLNAAAHWKHSRWPPYLTISDVTRAPGFPGSKVPNTKRHNKSKWEDGRVDIAIKAAERAPDLLHYSLQQKRLYYLPVDPVRYDALFSELDLPIWRGAFTVRDAMESCEAGELDASEERRAFPCASRHVHRDRKSERAPGTLEVYRVWGPVQFARWACLRQPLGGVARLCATLGKRWTALARWLGRYRCTVFPCRRGRPALCLGPDFATLWEQICMH